MAILQQDLTEINGGFEKKIESSAMGLMMDVLQRFQYQYPIKSTIRELVSNGIDSVTEKNVAKSILKGESKVSDYYDDIEGELYTDSKFDPNYYDPKYLSSDEKVIVTYHKGSTTEKDFVTVTDPGVGLGKYRLSKYFSLGYSTKRLSKLPLGKFGIGAKAPLSINPYYTIESNYNGLRYKFNVYNTKVESVIPKFNLSTGVENVAIEFETGTIYAEVTTELNGVTITMEAKKHHLQEYKDAVERQLMYFKNVEFYIKEDGYLQRQNFTPEILYEDDYLVISDNRYFNRPHILLNKVNYGFIDFKELELEDMLGNVGIKVVPEDVEISPSRESLVWSEKTKAMVLQRFKDASQSASNLIQKEMQDTDFIKWLKVCNSIKNKWSSSSSVIGRLANIVDLEKVDIRFSGDPTIKYSTRMLSGFSNKEVFSKMITKANKSGKKIERQETDSTFLNEVVILKSSRASNRKDKYLVSLYGRFTTLEKPEWLGMENPLSLLDENTPDNLIALQKKHELEEKIYNYLKASKELLIYEDIVVPEEFEAGEEEEELIDLENLSPEDANFAMLTREERRKVTGKTIIMTPRLKNTRYVYQENRIYEWQKIEIPVAEIDTWEEEEIYYGTDADSSVIEFVALLNRDNTHDDIAYPRDKCVTNDWMYKREIDWKGSYDILGGEAYRCPFFFSPHGVKLFKVAKDKVKLYQDFKHINKFFLRMNGNTLTMSNRLVKWNTARQVREQMHHLNFLFNLPLDIEQKTKYHQLKAYVKEHYVEMSRGGSVYQHNSQAYTDLLKHLDKVQQFQTLVKSGATSEDVALVAKEMWNSTDVQDAYAVDLDIIDTLNELLDWAKPVKDLLNSMQYLVGHTEYQSSYSEYKDAHAFKIPAHTEQAIIRYCQENNVI